MSKRGYISRYLLIVKRLKSRPYSSFGEISEYIKNQTEFLKLLDDTMSIGFSLRTFQRDIREIRNIFGVDIAYSRQHNGYSIFQSESENMNFQRMIEVFDVFNSLNLAQDINRFICLEKRPPQGTDNLYGLLHAIKNRKRIEFRYQKFQDDIVSHRSAEPYAMKEFRNRWYLVARDASDGIIKSFALDRLTDLEIGKTSFEYPSEFDVNKMFGSFFGIIAPHGMVPEEVVLAFDAQQGKYIKSLPLHDTQQVVKDTTEELWVKLKVCITYDFLMELLSFGSRVKVLKPDSLVQKVKKIYSRALDQYN